MAAAVDSFSLLYREVGSCVRDWMEPLVVVGALYACGRALLLLRGACTMLRVHVMPRALARVRGGRGPPLSERYGAWAVLNGTSSEVCLAYAEELARRGVHIVLISQSEEEEEGEETSSHAQRLSQLYGVQVEVLRVDFSLLGVSASKPVLLSLRDKDVGLLVNCLDPALDSSQKLLDQSEQAVWRAVGANVGGASLLARWLLPGMVARHRGALVNVYSGLPAHGSAMLAAVCGYMEQFSTALQYEYGPHGIFVQSLTPFQVSSRAEPGWLAPTAELYARHAITTLGISHHTTGYWLHALQYGAVSCIPRWIWMLGSRMFLALT